jgi:hypothetical protein
MRSHAPHVRYLGVEGGSGEAQMTDHGEYQEGAENKTRDASRQGGHGLIDDWLTHHHILSGCPVWRASPPTPSGVQALPIKRNAVQSANNTFLMTVGIGADHAAPPTGTAHHRPHSPAKDGRDKRRRSRKSDKCGLKYRCAVSVTNRSRRRGGPDYMCFHVRPLTESRTGR